MVVAEKMRGTNTGMGPKKLLTTQHGESLISNMKVVIPYSFLETGVKKIVATVLSLTVISAVIIGCDNYGKLQPDKDLTKAFEKHTLPNVFTYYYYWRDNMQYAVMGIGYDYTLKSELWNTVDFQTDRFKKMVQWIWTDHNYTPYGAYMLGPGGKKVGIWYSSISHATVDVNETQKTIVVIPDKPFLRGGPAK